MPEEKKIPFNKWIALHRPETAGLIISMYGEQVSEEEFLAEYKALGIPRTSPAKGKGIYRFLVRGGYLNHADNQ